MIIPNNNLMDLKKTIDHLNHMDTWGGSWEAPLVTVESIQNLVQENLELIINSRNDASFCLSFYELGKRLKKEPYFGQEAITLAHKIKEIISKITEIHFIWIGGDLPPKYLNNIKECAAKALSDKNRGFQYSVNLWVENRNNYWNTAIKEDNIIHGKRFKIRHLSELNSTIQNNFDKIIARKIFTYIRRELAGLKSFAAASDIIRYILLYKEGGLYSDTDNTFSILKSKYEIFDPFDPKISKWPDARRTFWERERLWEKRHESTFLNLNIPKNGLTMASEDKYPQTNCLILAEKGSLHLKGVIEDVIEKYDDIDNVQNTKGILFKINNNKEFKIVKNYSNKSGTLQANVSTKFKRLFEWPITIMDTKRSHDLSLGREGGRWNLTIESTLTPLCKKSKEIGNATEILDYYSYSGCCLNQPMIIHYDNTWLQKKHQHSFEDGDMGIDPFKITSVIERQRKFPKI